MHRGNAEAIGLVSLVVAAGFILSAFVMFAFVAEGGGIVPMLLTVLIADVFLFVAVVCVHIRVSALEQEFA